MSRMQPFRLHPKNPLNNETQKLHEKMEQESIMKKALMLPDNAGPFFEEFQRKFHLTLNLKLKVSLTKIAGSLLPNPIRPNRTEYRREICLYYLINFHWDKLGPILNSLTVEKLDKGVGYQISNGYQSWQADANGNVKIPFPGLQSQIATLTNENNYHVDQRRPIDQDTQIENNSFSQFYNFDYFDEFFSDAIFY